MDIGVISVRYASALIKAALGMKLEDQVYQEMQTLYKSYIDVPELRFTIDNPMLSKDKKLALLTTASSVTSQALCPGTSHHSPGQRAYGTEQEVYRSRLERG